MKLLLYYAAFSILGASASMGHKIEGSISLRPLNPVPTRLLTAIATFAVFGLFGWGFFAFAWWVPLTAILVLAFVGGTLTAFGIRSDAAPIIAMAYSIIGLVCGIAAIVL